MIENILYFAKVRDSAKIPSKIDENVGFDLYSCFDEDYIIINPFESKLIPTGLVSAFDKNYGMLFRERGSTGVKNLKVNAGVIDSGYRGEIFVCLYNANTKPLVITKEKSIELEEDYIVYSYDKAIAQAVIVEIPNMEVSEISLDEIKNISSERGEGSLGSSGK